MTMLLIHLIRHTYSFPQYLWLLNIQRFCFVLKFTRLTWELFINGFPWPYMLLYEACWLSSVLPSTSISGRTVFSLIQWWFLRDNLFSAQKIKYSKFATLYLKSFFPLSAPGDINSSIQNAESRGFFFFFFFFFLRRLISLGNFFWLSHRSIIEGLSTPLVSV